MVKFFHVAKLWAIKTKSYKNIFYVCNNIAKVIIIYAKAYARILQQSN